MGDKNNKFFQTPALIRRKRKFISQIKDDLGFFHDQHMDISNIFIDSFKKRFTSPGDATTRVLDEFLQVISPCISSDDNAKLLLPVSLDEVSIALHSIGPLKAPGPDGLHALFFQHFWPQVKDTIFNLVKDFFENGSLEAINHTLIV